jgi:hypothetical protein
MRAFIGAVSSFLIGLSAGAFLEAGILSEGLKMILGAVAGTLGLILGAIWLGWGLADKIWPKKDSIKVMHFDSSRQMLRKSHPMKEFVPWRSEWPQTDQMYLEIDFGKPRYISGIAFDNDSGNEIPARW